TGIAGPGTCSYGVYETESKWKCNTAATLSNTSGTIVISTYVLKDLLVSTSLVNQPCTYRTAAKSASATVNVPTFTDYQVTASSIGVNAATTITPVNNKKFNETTDIYYLSKISSANTIAVTIALGPNPATDTATITACLTNNAGNQINTPTWNKVWCPTTAGNPTTGCL
ncbi:MAG: hypothetical protein ABIP16_05455, partial [Thermomonas sp.]